MDGKLRVFLLSLVLLFAVAPAASAAGIGEVTGFGSNPGNLKMFRYAPDELAAGRPVVVALHGCTQDAAGYGTNTGWVQLAQRARFTLVLPQQQTANNISKCFTWFDGVKTPQEALSLKQMVDRAIADAQADPARVFVTGLSAGGAMTSAMLARYPATFKAGAVVAGLPYGCATSQLTAFSCMNPGKNLAPRQWGDKVRAGGHPGPWPVVGIWHGTADYTVNSANLTELAEQWTDVHGADAVADSRDTVAGFPHAVYRNSAGQAVVETFSITGMGHGQPVDPGQCGTAAPYLVDVNLCAAGRMAADWALAE
ncbi:PHB depolymerase family esterase [Amycolatopsis sp. cg5]|uniref:extracellular catalytic domain type 1 short-chain-length polyhydroxyalkanoate depolymerase n=1 Tax=Amycolatopsis sp. cg5 TaxID=3238802 RepID=UPI00352428D3